MKDHPQAHIIDLGAALQRAATSPRELTSGAVRNLPGTAPAERKEHGPITNLVRKDRSGCVAYEGTCDGEPVCIVELSPGVWRARTRDAVLAEGPLVEVLGVAEGDEWRAPDGEPWAVRSRYTVGIELESLCEYYGTKLCAHNDAAQFLADGWRPVST